MMLCMQHQAGQCSSSFKLLVLQMVHEHPPASLGQEKQRLKAIGMVKGSLLSSCCLVGEMKTYLNRDKKYFRLKSKGGFAHFGLNRGQALVLQKSWRISACQVSFLVC